MGSLSKKFQEDEHILKSIHQKTIQEFQFHLKSQHEGKSRRFQKQKEDYLLGKDLVSQF